MILATPEGSFRIASKYASGYLLPCIETLGKKSTTSSGMLTSGVPGTPERCEQSKADNVIPKYWACAEGMDGGLLLWADGLDRVLLKSGCAGGAAGTLIPKRRPDVLPRPEATVGTRCARGFEISSTSLPEPKRLGRVELSIRKQFPLYEVRLSK